MGARGAGAEAWSVSVLGELRGPRAVPAHGDGLPLHAAGYILRGAGVEVRPSGAGALLCPVLPMLGALGCPALGRAQSILTWVAVEATWRFSRWL